MRQNWSKYIWILFWVIGLILLAYISYTLELRIKNHAQTDFNMLPIVWYKSIAPFIFGIYISLIFVKVWSFRWSAPLTLCVTVPCLIIALYNPVIFTIAQDIPFLQTNYFAATSFWMLNVNSLGIPSIVAGLTLMVGLFSQKT
ncbi:hypothetical protein [Psychrobacillus vulpis]|uniref:Uncharacterized protein n=1 Tax=Psychrobacillus vulpis TaxID=2325572 RepID=A0A544TPH7_9BACI|nr:hypothetical protein [Psychrobacillus vulpis]TQR19319.1 hypothetical protein FG384_12890 [Psychrobacillus vulpis]